jgi:hypothetical protein
VDTIVEISSMNGIVGFFDILGYTSFLENNEPDDIAKKVVALQNDLPRKVPNIAKDLLNKDCELASIMVDYIKQIRWIIFSDTILISSHYRNQDDINIKLDDWLLFLITSIILYHHFFVNGLPLRGSISYGKYFVDKQCFVGRPIVHSYKAQASIDLSAIVLHDSSVKELQSIKANEHISEFFSNYIIEYPVPLRDGNINKQHLLSPSFPILKSPNSKDMRQFVANSFWDHNKNITPEVMNKLNNTELYFRFCKKKNPKIFGTSH